MNTLETVGEAGGCFPSLHAPTATLRSLKGTISIIVFNSAFRAACWKGPQMGTVHTSSNGGVYPTSGEDGDQVPLWSILLLTALATEGSLTLGAL